MQNEAKALADARQEFEEFSAAYAERKREFEESISPLTKGLAEAKEAVSSAEEALRAAGLAHYEAHPDSKKLPFGLGVRVTTALVYDADTAFAWAQEHKMALSLDKRAFEKIAKASPPEFVTVEEVPTVTIPTDTAKLLQENE